MVSHISTTMNTHGIPYTIYYEYPWYPIYHLLWIPVVSHIPSTMNKLEALKCILLKNGTINFSYNNIRIFRRVARNIWGQQGFLQAQILNSSEGLNYMQTWISLSNANNSSWYTISLRKSPKTSTSLLLKIKDAMFLFLYHILGLYIPVAIKQ